MDIKLEPHACPIDSKLALLDAAKLLAKVLQQSHERMNICHISWTLVCMSHYYIFIRFEIEPIILITMLVLNCNLFMNLICAYRISSCS